MAKDVEKFKETMKDYCMAHYRNDYWDIDKYGTEIIKMYEELEESKKDDNKKVLITSAGWAHTGKIGEFVSARSLGSKVIYLIRFEDGQSREMERRDFEFV